MAQFKCEDCGTIFDGSLSSCPSCGCPLSACSKYEEQPQQPHSNNQQTDTQTESQSTTENVGYYYVDFSTLKWQNSDSFIIKFCINNRFLRWLFAPFHVGGNHPTNAQQAANEIFFILNRFYKFIIYPQVWALCKLLLFLVIVIVGSIASMGILLAPLFIAYIIAAVWFGWIGVGKSVDRYGIPMLKVMRSLCVRVKNSIK